MGVPVKEKKSNIIDFPRQVRVKAKLETGCDLEKFVDPGFRPKSKDPVKASENFKKHNDIYMPPGYKKMLNEMIEASRS